MKTIFLTIFLSILSVQISNAQWVQMSNGMGNLTVWSLAVNGNNIFAGNYPGGQGIYISTNNGTSWTQTSLNYVSVMSLAINGNDIFAGTSGSGIYLSTNNGTSWTQTSLNNQSVWSLLVNGNNIFAGTSVGVYLSTNNGTSWTQTSLNYQNVRTFAVSGNNIFAGTNGSGVYLSTNNGTTWTQTSLNNLYVWSLAVNGNTIFAGIHDNPGQGVYLSTDNGTSWTQTSLNNQRIISLAVNGNNIFAGRAFTGGGVYVSTDNGTSWILRNEGLSVGAVYALCILNNYIFAGTDISVWRRPLSELTGIHPVSNEVPNQFSLSQNYPNPFNPSTKIKFALTKSSFAKLVVFDALGQEVETLVNEQLNAGTYEAVWSADKFSSGVYYYKLISGEFSQTNKMILLK